MRCRQKILRRFCADLFDTEERRHVVCYLVPYIGQQVERRVLPFPDLLASLLPPNWWQFLGEDDHAKPSLELKVQSPLLFAYALLNLANRYALGACSP